MQSPNMFEFSEEQKSAFSRAATLCSKAEKSPGAIEKKLVQWGLSEDETDPVMQRLFADQYLDEARFATSYARDKFRFNKWGRVKIAYHLKAERISSAAIEDALTELDEEAYFECLEQLVQEKVRKTKAANEHELKSKVFRFAQGRGFEADLIWAAIKNALA